MADLHVVIDPGHYEWYNPGVVKNYYEGNKMFILAWFLHNELLKYDGIVPHVTRQNVSDAPSLKERADMVQTYGAELFLSLHTNAIADTARWQDVYGTLIYGSVVQPNSNTLGNQLIDAVVGLIAPHTNNKTYNRGIVRIPQNPNVTPLVDYYGVLRYSSCYPVCKYSFILEHAFHTQIEECTWLNDDANLQKLAVAEASVIAKYFNKSKKDSSNTSTLYMKKVTDETGLNIRNKPDVSGGKVGEIPHLQDFVVSEILDSGWGKLATGYYVNISDAYSRHSGNIASYDDIQPSVGTLEIPSGKFEITLKTDMNVRMGANRYYNAVGVIPTNTVLTVDSVLLGWAHVSYNGIDGYIRLHSEYCTIVNSKRPLYHVQAGAFKNKEYAENYRRTMIAKGFSGAYIVTSDDYYRVQIGSFYVKTYADEMVQSAKKAGLDTFITITYE